MSLRNQPYFPLYVQDYLTDEKLNNCSAASQGVYIKILCVMHKSDQYGKILFKQKDKQKTSSHENFALKLSRLLPFDYQTIFDALAELVEEDVLQMTGEELSQKRMVQDGIISLKRSEAAKKGGGNPNLFKQKSKQKPKQNPEYEYEYENEVENEIKVKKMVENPFGVTGEALWARWVEYKQAEHRERYKSPATEQAAIKHLFKLADGDIAKAEQIIDRSIANRWKGLFKIEKENHGTEKLGTSAARIQAAANF